MRALSPKQQKFVEYYAACGNATAAAREAGYRKPRSVGSENLAKPDIQAALAELTAKIASQRIADVIERQEYWTALMRNQIKGDPEMIKIGLKASELLGKAQSDFIAKVEHSLGLAAPDWSALISPTMKGQ